MRAHGQPRASAPPRVAVAIVLALVTAACGDDPEVQASTATRPHGVTTAEPFGGSDALDDGASGDTSGPPDTTVADTTPDTSRPDTSRPDTSDTDVADTGPTDTGPTDTSTPEGPRLIVPPTLALPWVQAGQGGSNRAFELDNLGGAGPISATLSGAPSITLDTAPTTVAEDTPLRLTLRFAGASTPTTAEALLRVTAGGVTHEARVYAVAGKALPAASWQDLKTGATLYGRTTTVKLATAPFPDPGASWSDDSVNVFVPDGFVDRGPVPYVVHFHGHGTTLSETLPYHKYREQLWASGVNAVLVTPQGPVNAASGNFGKLMRAGGLAALLADVTSILYRDGYILTPKSGDATLTEHSGGYQAVALNLGATFDEGQVLAAHLFDGLYGYVSAYEAFPAAGGFLRSNHTAGGGTRANNLALLDDLGGLATDAFTAAALRSEPAVIWPTTAAHGDCTWWEQGFSEALRWGSRHARAGPRVELRSAIASGGTATVTWLAPDDDFTTGYRVETSPDGRAWTTAAEVGLERATFPLTAGRHVRVVPVVDGLDPNLALPSDSAFVEPDAEVLVVDGFDRLLGGSWTGLRHDHAARVGAAAKAAMASNEAVLEGEVALSGFTAVIWLLGDESVADHTFTAAEQALARAYLDQGGALIASGSELAYDLRTTGNSFLGRLGAVYVGDDANQSRVKGVGPLSTVPSMAFGGAGAPYPEDFPDILGAATGATVLLHYDNGMVAGVGRAGEAAALGFPLETIEDTAALAALVDALLGFVDP